MFDLSKCYYFWADYSPHPRQRTDLCRSVFFRILFIGECVWILAFRLAPCLQGPTKNRFDHLLQFSFAPASWNPLFRKKRGSGFITHIFIQGIHTRIPHTIFCWARYEVVGGGGRSFDFQICLFLLLFINSKMPFLQNWTPVENWGDLLRIQSLRYPINSGLNYLVLMHWRTIFF